MTLSKGDKGEKIIELQASLLNQGFELPKFGIDGIFGPETENAVRGAQERYGLPVNGQADSHLLRRLGHSVPSTGNPKKSNVKNMLVLGVMVGALAYVVHQQKNK